MKGPSTPLEQLQREVLDTCFKRSPSDADFERLGHAERWRVYRDMVRARLRRVNEAALPRTRSALGDEGFGELFTRWLDEAPPRTRYFREVPMDFLGHALAHLRDEERPWLADLARYELATWRVKQLDDRDAPATVDLSFDRAPVLTPALELLDVGWSVHRPRKAHDYSEGKFHLVIYRSRDHRAVTMELNALARDLVADWRSGDETLTERVHRVAQRRNTAIDEGFIESLGTMLADFLERGILLGSRADDAPSADQMR